METWKDIKNYEGYYQVSNLGNIRSIDRIVKQTNSKNKDKFQYNHYKGVILKTFINNSGYECITLTKSSKSRNFLVHRLVAEAFLEKTILDSVINHKDENKINNIVENLEWCTPKYNSNYGTNLKRISSKLGKKVYQYDINKNLINIFNSSKEASFYTKIPDRGIRKACYSNKLYKNYFWSYENNK